MHPRMFHWGRGPHAHRECCGSASDWPEQVRHHHHYVHPGDELGGGAFGVRRPLRFLAWKLHLTEPQTAEFAAILNDVKTERAQAAVDDRRALTAFADAVAAEGFDGAKAAEGERLRVQSAERLQGVIAKALGRMHASLDPEQRSRLAYLIRTGTLLI